MTSKATFVCKYAAALIASVFGFHVELLVVEFKAPAVDGHLIAKNAGKGRAEKALLVVKGVVLGEMGRVGKRAGAKGTAELEGILEVDAVSMGAERAQG